MQQSESIANLAAALVKVQPKLQHPKKNAKNPHLKNRFADLGSVIDANRDLLAEHGLAVVQTTTRNQWSDSHTSQIGVRTSLVHESGEYILDECLIPLEPQKGLNLPQCAGVAITYLRRYGWQTILGLNAEDDTDGATGGDSASSTPRDVDDLL